MGGRDFGSKVWVGGRKVLNSRRLIEQDATAVCELFVFVYGTLKPGGRYHARFCAQGLVAAKPGLVKGRLYDFEQLGYPAVSRGDGWVKGYLLQFSGTRFFCDGVLRGLDALEGYVGEGEENEYERCEVQVFDVMGEPLRQAWLYVMDEERIQKCGGVYLLAGDWPFP